MGSCEGAWCEDDWRCREGGEAEAWALEEEGGREREREGE